MGRQAKQGMQARILDGERRVGDLFEAVVKSARLFQGGGNELTTSSLREGVETAGGNALVRLLKKRPFSSACTGAGSGWTDAPTDSSTNGNASRRIIAVSSFRRTASVARAAVSTRILPGWRLVRMGLPAPPDPRRSRPERLNGRRGGRVAAR